MYIGIDSEWKPTQFSGESHSKPSLLQVSGETEAFLIDLVALEKSKVLDEMLSSIFSNKNSIVIGFGFKSDIEQFQKRLPHLNFLNKIESFIDAQNFYGKLYIVQEG
jgi:hypothetical protein